jgi:hypothetical protein
MTPAARAKEIVMDVKVSVIEVDQDQGFVNFATLKQSLEKTCRKHQKAGYAIVSVIPITSCLWGGFSMSSGVGLPSSAHGLADIPYSYTSAVMVISQK